VTLSLATDEVRSSMVKWKNVANDCIMEKMMDVKKISSPIKKGGALGHADTRQLKRLELPT
jgi:hypothetical protein